ncbi:hypothetical protein [Pseudactinotalea sp. Z1748]|uniref:hypothetical protein n=1 Tax=Pseudactinotalea sp. Z1748 TaxID=3413027 RepID=UPI003C7C1B02
MGSIVVTHDEHGNTQVLDPEHEFALLMPDRTILADSRTELLDAIIDGYHEARTGQEGDREAAWLRYTTLISLADVASAGIFAAMVNDGSVALEDFDENNLNTILPPSRIATRPFTGHWDNKIPLILIRSDYEPHSHLELPTGNVYFLDPTNEATFLDSMVSAGMAELHVREDAAA